MRIFKILTVIGTTIVLTLTLLLIVNDWSMWPARGTQPARSIEIPTTEEGPISLKGGYWGDAETPEYFLLWDFWFYEKPSIWAPNSWIPFDRIGSGANLMSVVPSSLIFTDDVDIMADLPLNDLQLNVIGTVDVRKEINGILHWSVNGMAKRLWRLEARIRELEILMEAR